MKKNFITFLICCIAIFSCYISIVQNNSAQTTDIISANIEALAQEESGGPNWWTQPETKGCKLELGGGWFTASVERVCTFCATPNSCTPVACGEEF